MPEHSDTFLSCLVFHAESAVCAVESRSVSQLLSAREWSSGQIVLLSALGLTDRFRNEEGRLLFVKGNRGVVPLAVGSEVELEDFSASDVIPLPDRPYRESVFSALIAAANRSRVLLLDPERLLSLTLATPGQEEVDGTSPSLPA